MLAEPNMDPTKALHIRRYRPTDYETVWRLHADALRAAGAHAGDGPWDDDLRQIEAVYLDNGGEFLVGVLHGRVVAMGALNKTSSKRAEIKRMRVSPAYQRNGFGQAILSALERRAVELGYAALHLDTTVQQRAAQGLYVKNGYREAGRSRTGRFESVFYEKSDLPQNT
jgi:ribosomal protein S18 acetylase RimI-like enzyme